MTDSTSDFLTKTTQPLTGHSAANPKGRRGKTIKIKDYLSPSADTLFFVRLFARACQPVC